MYNKLLNDLYKIRNDPIKIKDLLIPLIKDFEIIDDINNISKKTFEDFRFKIYNNKLIVEYFKKQTSGGKVGYLVLVCLKHFTISRQILSSFIKGHNSCKKCYTKHCWSSHPIYKSNYANMIDRCCNPNNKYYHNYGGAGIFVCDKWKDNFLNFLDDMYDSYLKFIDENPTSIPTLERINNNDGYYKENCIWLDKRKQNQNKRTNVFTLETASCCAYEFNKLNYSNPYLTNRYKFKKDTIRSITSRNISWKNIYELNDSEYTILLLKNINNINILALPDKYIVNYKLCLFKYILMNTIYKLGIYTKIARSLNMEYNNITAMKGYKNDTYYNIKSYKQFLIYLIYLENYIDVSKLKEKYQDDFKKFKYAFNIKNDYILYNLKMEKIVTKYKTIVPMDIINKILNNEIYNWYNPIEFIKTPLKYSI